MLPISLLYLILFNIRTTDADGLNYQVFRGRYYSTVRIQSSGYLCISNSPSMIIKSMSLVQCTQECFHHAGCDDFNVIDGGTGNVDCQLYVKSNPLNYTVKKNCRAYQLVYKLRYEYFRFGWPPCLISDFQLRRKLFEVHGSTEMPDPKNMADDKACTAIVSVRAPSGPTGNLIPARCCPFSLNGVINNRCVINPPLVHVGCYMPQRIWATCQLPADFTAGYMTFNMSMPGNSSVKIPVQSINSWLVIYNQVIGGMTSFIQNWKTYRNGFGSASLSDNFWLGNELVYKLTSAAKYSLRVEVQRPTTLIWQSVEYSSFSISSESTKYTLRVSGFSGDTVDAFNPSLRPNYGSNGRNFSTYDSDNDICPCNCAVESGDAGWWYGWCSTSRLTSPTVSGWYQNDGQEMYAVSSRMMIKFSQ